MPVQAERSRNAGGRATRQALIRTAECLFAEQGIDAVSLRRISATAGLRMTGAVAYHFGDKDGLIRAIIDDRDGPIDERRRALLAELERDGRTHDLRAVADVGIRPSAEAIGRTGHYFRFLAQLDRHPSALSEAFASGAFRSALDVLELQVEAGLDHLPPTILEQRKRLCIHLVVGALADLEAQARGPVDEAVTSDLIDCVVALYSAPPSAQTLEASKGGSNGSPALRP
jgi:AcrR family transcriptional regulator